MEKIKRADWLRQELRQNQKLFSNSGIKAGFYIGVPDNYVEYDEESESYRLKVANLLSLYDWLNEMIDGDDEY